MILLFPDYDTLRLALTSGVVPTTVSLEPAVAGVDEDGRPWLDTPAKLSRSVSNQLAKFGVVSLKTYPSIGEELSNWLQALPLEREDKPPELSSNAPVLFELPNPAQLPEVVGEMLRLSVDRQSFRWMKEDDSSAGPVLLRVVGPPYYTLLRALDRERPGGGGQIRAYVEQAPQVWVEIGWTHPLVKSLAPNEGQMLILRAPRDWVFLADAPFRDIYEILDFKLPQSRFDWQTAELKKRLIVPLRLIESDRHDVELWALRDKALEQLDALVRDAKDGLLQRLIFAVGERDGQVTIVLRVRPSKQPPPQLVLQAEAYSKYLKLDNLFVPQATKIHPVLRRDAIRKLLADDPAQINWLRPHPEKPGAFIPESLPDDAFRPLHEWVDYVLDHDRAVLTSWVQEFRFDFDPFVCTEESADAKPKGPPDRGKRKGPTEEEEVETRTPRPTPQPKKREPNPRAEKDEFAEIEVKPPSRIREELTALEKQFVEMPAALDDPDRLPLWSELAIRNAALPQPVEAAICWMNLLWELLDLRAEADDVRREADAKRQSIRQHRLDRLRQLLARYGGEEELAWQWVRSESFFKQHLARKFSDLLETRQLTTAHLDELLGIEATAPHEVRALLACVIWGSLNEAASVVLRERLSPILQFVERNEKMMPVRAVWLAWHSLAKLTGDALTLARVRDRLIDRLMTDGLSPERDLPTFLRTAGHHDSDRMQSVHAKIGGLHEQALDWCAQCMGENNSGLHYIDLIFAFGLARLGEPTRARELLRKAETNIAKKKNEDTYEVHDFLLRAFRYRIEEALKGRPHAGPLPAEWRAQLDSAIPKGQSTQYRYIVDRMREFSRILEPQEKLEPYRDFTAKQNPPLEQKVGSLGDIKEPGQLQAAVNILLKNGVGKPPTPDEQMTILSEALSLSPRVGESFCLELLARVQPVLDKLPPATPDSKLVEPQAIFLERALLAAANYDRQEIVRQLLGHFVQLLQKTQSNKSHTVVANVNRLFNQCLRSLRKLGMRDEMSQLIEHLTRELLGGQGIERIRTGALRDSHWQYTVQTLLNLTSGWLTLGQMDRAGIVLDAARELLFDPGDPFKIFPQLYTNLACNYVAALGHAQIEYSIKRIEELFAKMRRLKDTFTSSRYYPRLHLTIVEAVVFAIVHEDFGMGPGARRWMDDDEFLVRRRIHRDHRFMLARG